MENLSEATSTLRNSESIWALIIGINEYEDNATTNLNGAVQDAKAMRDFLISQHVPEKQIRMLTDEDATYTGIVNAFVEHLITNPDIRHGDPLLFYFAGHGTRYNRKRGERYAICPSNRNTTSKPGAKVPDIVERTLGGMLATLADAKGNNITVILDCCHSCSSHRGLEPMVPMDGIKHLHPRYAPPIEDNETVRAMFVDLKHLKPTTQGVRMVAGELYGEHLTTHVLLMACLESDKAYESEKAEGTNPKYSGLFTSTLLDALKKGRLPQLTFDDLIRRVQDRMTRYADHRRIQFPLCIGRNKQRTIFTLGWNRRLVPITLLPEGRLRVEAGAIHGVSVGTEFCVWPDENITTDPSRGKLVATEVFSVYALVEAESGFTPEDKWYASVSRWDNAGDPYFPVHVAFREETAQDEWQRLLEESLQPGNTGQPHDGIEVAVVLEKAAIPLISVSDVVMKIERTDPCTGTVDVELPCLSLKKGLELLNRVLRFELHLARKNMASPLLRFLEISFVRVDAHGTPVSQNLFDELHRAYLPNDGANHSFIVANHGPMPLWVLVYYFDPATYTVSEFYVPPSHMMEPPLQPNNELVIGNANSGVHPFSFIMKEGLEEDSGFAKIFVSETYTNLAMLEEQDESFYEDPRRTGEVTGHSEHGTWDSVVTTITVRR